VNHVIATRVRFALRHPEAGDGLARHLNRMPVVSECAVAWGERRIPVSKGRHHGGYASLFPCQPVLRFESELERRVLKQFASIPGCAALATQPVTIRFWLDGRSRRYTPDVLVVFEFVPKELAIIGFRRFTFVEVKPLGFAGDPADLWSARRQALEKALGIPLVRFPHRGGN